MYSLERQETIIRLLEEKTSISVQELTRLFGVSAPTVRRDLDELVKKGRISRTHGGVMKQGKAGAVICAKSVGWRAEQILPLIKDGAVVFLDASVSFIASMLGEIKDLCVITNSPSASLILAEQRIRHYCTGGKMNEDALGYVGSEAEDFISLRNADLCFFSDCGYCDGIITHRSEEEGRLCRLMLRQARKSYFLCQKEQIGKKYLYNVCQESALADVIEEI